jgi:hypothetical protein
MEVPLESACKIRGSAISTLDGDRFDRKIRCRQELSGGRQPPLFGIFPDAQSPRKFEQSGCVGGRNIQLEFSARVSKIPTDTTVTAVDKVCQLRNSLIAVNPCSRRAGKQAA